MGCDIHVYLERWTNIENKSCPRLKSGIRNNKIENIIEDNTIKYKWESMEEWYFDEDDNCFYTYRNNLYKRNYNLFSYLADVRNYGDIVPLAYPKGIPEDASDSYLYECDMNNGDAHSHTYFLLEELLNVEDRIWKELYAEEFIENLRLIEGDPKLIRLCMFFDN